jgi:integrase/recombinase XerD
VSALATRAEDYVRLRRAFGAKLTETAPMLTAFTAYLDGCAQATVTIDAALAWAARGAPSRAQLARRLAVIRGFAEYVQAFDPATEVPPGHLLPAGPTRTTPHIYTDDQVTALLAAARDRRPELHGAALATLIGLMAAAGLRTGEALRLDRDDLDLGAGTLAIRDSKYGKSRRIPLHPTTVAALDEYATLRDRHIPQPVDTTVLLSTRGRRISPAMLHRWFPAVRAEVGIVASPGSRPPRLYDLRHTFAVRTLSDWHTAGVDVRRQLPVLSTYLGHANPDNTYWYLQATPELMNVLADRAAAHLDGDQQ